MLQFSMRVFSSIGQLTPTPIHPTPSKLNFGQRKQQVTGSEKNTGGVKQRHVQNCDVLHNSER